MEPTFTLCFIRHKDQYLMLFRNKEPNKNRWNGVGGKIESGESPTASCLREIYEETSLDITSISFRGIVTWKAINEGAMYVFVAESETDHVISNHEGRLEWKSLDWILTNKEVVSNIPLFLPAMLEKDDTPLEHEFTYSQDGEIIAYDSKAIDPTFIDRKM